MTAEPDTPWDSSPPPMPPSARAALVDHLGKLQRMAHELTAPEWWNIWRALVSVYRSHRRLN